MADVIAVAACILNQLGDVTTMKLQKLVYYSQAVHLVDHNEPLFPDKIEAWANGPVVRKLFAQHRGMFLVGPRNYPFAQIDVTSALAPEEMASIRRVTSVLGNKSGGQLVELTHREQPWINARGTLAPGAYGGQEISRASIRRFYSSPAASTNPLFRR